MGDMLYVRPHPQQDHEVAASPHDEQLGTRDRRRSRSVPIRIVSSSPAACRGVGLGTPSGERLGRRAGVLREASHLRMPGPPIKARTSEQQTTHAARSFDSSCLIRVVGRRRTSLIRRPNLTDDLDRGCANLGCPTERVMLCIRSAISPFVDWLRNRVGPVGLACVVLGTVLDLTLCSAGSSTQ
jgi:hypothetical protein